jgi:tetratricopeptide (TPR) repeat protein
MSATAASAEQAGTQSPFRFGFGARDLALGGSDISGCDFSTAPFWNASRLALAPNTQVSVFHANLYESGINYDYAGIVWPTLDFGAVGLGIARLGVNGIERRDAGNVLLGHFSDERFGVFLGYGRTLAGYDLGLTVTLEHHQVDTYSATSSPGIDFSITRRFPLALGWIRGAALTFDGGNLVNPTTDLVAETVRYPRRYSGAASLVLRPAPSSLHSIRLSARLESSTRDEATSALGAEYSIGSAIQMRGGFRGGNLSAGAGLGYRSFRFDYGLVGRDLGGIHMFTLTSTFGTTVNERKRHRRERQEQEFQRVMVTQLQRQNSELVATLTHEGDSSLAAGAHEDAFRRFDRALFLARTNGVDTTAIAGKADAAQMLVQAAERKHHYAYLLDSATACYESHEYLGSRYYAELAMREDPAGDSARVLQGLAIAALENITARDQLIRSRLSVIDSLQAVGDNANALIAAEALSQFDPGNDDISLTIRRIRFEIHRATANRYYAQGKTASALAALDSASALYPKHQWCDEFRATLRARQFSQRTVEAPARAEKPVTLSKELAAEADLAYREGKGAFESGNLGEAISAWERVERIAPGYESVRDYLVKAYRLMGVELYGQNELEAALNLWRSATRLDPGNSEIQAFIARAEAELGRLKELSYDEQ